MQIEKIICDICGREAADKDFILPFYNSYDVRGGKGEAILCRFFDSEPTKTKMDLCDCCMHKLALVIKEMKGIPR